MKIHKILNKVQRLIQREARNIRNFIESSVFWYGALIHEEILVDDVVFEISASIVDSNDRIIFCKFLYFVGRIVDVGSENGDDHGTVV